MIDISLILINWCKNNGLGINHWYLLDIYYLEETYSYQIPIMSMQHFKEFYSMILICFICVCIISYPLWTCHDQEKYISVSVTIFYHNSNSTETLFCSYPNSDILITIKFCTCHDSTHIVTCAKFVANWWSAIKWKQHKFSIEFEMWYKKN